MVENLSNFCASIICTIMVGILIQMVVPDGKNKKYVMFVCGLVITIALVEPIIDLMNIDLEKVFEDNRYLYSEYRIDEDLYDKTLQDSYKKILVEDIVNRLKENGYSVSNVSVEYDEVDFKPVRIFMDLEGESGFVQPVKIEVGNSKSESHDVFSVNRIKGIISETYGITKENVIIN